MSLDVNLIRKRWISYDDGKTNIEEEETVYDANITHNLGKMAREAGIYEACWRPYRLHPDYKETENYDEEMRFEQEHPMKAKDIILLLDRGIVAMKSRPEYYKGFDSENGWGLYVNFLPWLERYYEACKQYPDAKIEISR